MHGSVSEFANDPDLNIHVATGEGVLNDMGLRWGCDKITRV